MIRSNEMCIFVSFMYIMLPDCTLPTRRTPKKPLFIASLISCQRLFLVRR